MKVGLAVLAAAAGVALATSAQAAALLPSGGYSENFDSMGTGTVAPTGWTSVSLSGSGSTVKTEADVNANISAVATFSSTVTTAAGGAAMAKNIQIGSGTDRALGSLPTGVTAVLTQLDLTNSTGGPLSSVNFSYTVMNFTANANGNYADELYGYRFGYSTDGVTFTRMATLDGIPATDLTTATTVSQTINFSSPVANGGTMSFRFFDDNADGSYLDVGQMITNVAVTVPEPTTLSLLGLAALPLLRRRRA